MSRKGENIYKRKDGRWEGRYIKFYNENKKPKYGYVYGKTYSETKKKLLEVQTDLNSGKILNSNKMICFEELLNTWLQSVQINIKESTYARYNHLIKKHISPELGKYLINKVSTQLVEKYINNLLSNGRLDNNGGLSPKTVTDILTIIKSTIDYAKYCGYSIICNLSKLTIKKADKEMRVLSQKEQDSLTSVLLRNIDLYKLGVLLSLYTGIRIGELCALRWENLSVKTRTLKVRETMQRIQNNEVNKKSKTKIVITKPKSKCSIRDIPLPDFMIDIIKQFQNTPKAYVLTGDKNKYIEPRTMQYRFQTYVKQSGIAKTNYHALRHTFATRCVEAGFEIKTLSEILGHTNVNITLNKYVHSSFELKRSNMNKLTLSA